MLLLLKLCIYNTQHITQHWCKIKTNILYSNKYMSIKKHYPKNAKTHMIIVYKTFWFIYWQCMNASWILFKMQYVYVECLSNHVVMLCAFPGVFRVCVLVNTRNNKSHHIYMFQV